MLTARDLSKAQEAVRSVRGLLTGILVNSACPGWVRTDMGGPGAPRSVEQGADTIVWLATAGAKGPTGGFFSERKDRMVITVRLKADTTVFGPRM
jgi:NAD(P)-dependent dehydrogenase (short-subunit alcohol dehydrogenase family)